MYKFHREHTWIKMNMGKATIGLTFFAQAHLGEIVYLDLPEIGSSIQAGQPMGGIESTKTTTEVISPLSGLVLESNEELAVHPTLINDSPMEKGWITRIQPSEPDEMDLLMEREVYEEYLSEQTQVENND